MKLIKKHYHDKGLKKIPTFEAGYKLLKLISFFDPSVKLLLPRVGMETHFDNTKSRELLGMTYDRAPEDTIIDMVEGMIEHGIIQFDQDRQK